ncbi:hypothetical protein FQA39_LY00344 [Lamprigera yunnana]|nr:hypothetical protein FQA39_LY00344 [Lamprigera yunnana]
MPEENNENTRLLSGDAQPRYLMQPTIVHQRYRRLKRFQCCLCTIFLSAIVVFVVFAVSYSIQNDENVDNSNSSSITFTNNTSLLLTLSWPITDRKEEPKCFNHEDLWQEALEFGSNALGKRDKLEEKIPTLEVNTPSYRHQKTFIASNKSRMLSRDGIIKENAWKYLMGKNNMFIRSCNKTLSNTSNIYSECESKKYRTYDGSCNNLKHPFSFGVALTSFRRALSPDYADGSSEPRVAVDGKSLPNARNVSVLVHRPLYKNDTQFTIMLAVWGQFIDHDITATALSQTSHGKNIACCLKNEHPDCFSIPIDKEDSFFHTCNVTCMQFVRSAAAPNDKLGPRQQLNQVSSFIDGSVVYGSTIDIVNELREFQDGKLKTYVTKNNKTLLPLSTDLNDGCNREEQNKLGRYCFMSGDQRSNENLHLTSIHLIWVRQHNYLASELKRINPFWDDEKIFQEVRKIIIAQLQHITYNEFLKIIIGPTLRKKLNLNPQKNGYYKGYDKNVDASVANNFAAASFRFGHTLIPALFKLLDHDTVNEEHVQMHKMLFNPFSLYEAEGLDRTLRGAMNSPIEASDTYFNDETSPKPVYERKYIGGGDVTSKNLLPLLRVLWKLETKESQVTYAGDGNSQNQHPFYRWTGLIKVLNNKNTVNLYIEASNVDDVDLYSGGISEKPLEGGILGPTFTCLIGDQFVRLKRGDRIWYENPYAPHAFTLEQLNEIRLTTLAKVICDNSDSVDQVQLHVMQRTHESNKYTPCIEIPRPDLTKWKDGDLILNNISNKSISVE